jgi:hypothetical protein
MQMLPSAAETRGNSTASLPLLQHTGICGTCTIALRSKPSLPPHVHLQVRFWGPRSPETRMLESLENRRVPLVTSPHAVASSGVTLRVRLWKRRIKRGLLRPSSRKRWDIFNFSCLSLLPMLSLRLLSSHCLCVLSPPPIRRLQERQLRLSTPPRPPPASRSMHSAASNPSTSPSHAMAQPAGRRSSGSTPNGLLSAASRRVETDEVSLDDFVLQQVKALFSAAALSMAILPH